MKYLSDEKKLEILGKERKLNKNKLNTNKLKKKKKEDFFSNEIACASTRIALKKVPICPAVRWDRNLKKIFEVILLKKALKTLQHFRETCTLKFQKQSSISQIQKC